MLPLSENLLANIPCGIFYVTEDGKIVWVNIFFAKLLGYSEAEMIGKDIKELMGTAGKIFYGTHLYPIIKMHGRADEIFLKFRSKAGTDIPVLLNATTTIIENEITIIGTCMAVLNRGAYEAELLAAKKKAEEDLEHGLTANAQKEKAEQQNLLLNKHAQLAAQQDNELVRLSSIISHDLQEPLRKLSVYASVLQQQQAAGKTTDRALFVIQKSAVEIRRRLLQLQDYMDIQRDAPLDEKIILDGLVMEKLEELKIMFPNIAVNYSIENLPTITGNHQQLALLFFELLKNCFTHGTLNDALQLAIKGTVIKENIFHFISNKYRYKDYVQITISDAGNGFEASQEEYVFEMLNRLGDSNASPGIGLSICKRIVTIHSGKIWANGNPGKGAKFFIRLPIFLPE